MASFLPFDAELDAKAKAHFGKQHLFQPEGFQPDINSPFYITPEEQQASTTAWNKAQGMDVTERAGFLQDFYASDPDLMQMQDRTAQAIEREAAKPLATPTGPGVGAQAGAVNELRLLGIEDPYSNQASQDALKGITESIRKGGYQNIVDNRTPVQQLYAANPDFLPDNNTLGTPHLTMGGTRNKTDLIQDAILINPDGSAKSTEEQAAAVAETEEKLEVAPTLFTPEGDFVDNLYEQTGIDPDAEGFQHWVEDLLGGDSVETVESNFLDAASGNPASNNYVPPETPPLTPPLTPPVTPPVTSQIPAGQEGWWNQFADADAFKSFLQGDQQQQSNTSMQDFMQFMMMMNMMGGMGGGRGFGGSQYGYGGLNPGGVQSAYNPLEQLQGSWDWFNKSFGSGVQGGSTANVQ